MNQCQISVGAMGLAIQRYLGSNERGGGVTTVLGASTSGHRQNAQVPVATLRIILHRPTKISETSGGHKHRRGVTSTLTIGKV